MQRVPDKTVQHAQWLIHHVCRFAVGGIWIYQGLVPKLLGPHADELAMAQAAGIPLAYQTLVSFVAGAAEVIFGMLLIMRHRQAWPQCLSAILTALLLAFVAVSAPAYLVAAFNPVVMNGASLALSAIALIQLRDAQRAA